MTLEASSLKLKARIIAEMRVNPSKATAEEQSSFSVNSTSLQIIDSNSPLNNRIYKYNNPKTFFKINECPDKNIDVCTYVIYFLYPIQFLFLFKK